MAGSRKGIPNRATAARERAIRESGLTPLEFLLSIMRGEYPTDTRIDAAKAAAPYVHPKLIATEMKVSGSLITEVQNRIIDHGQNS